MWIELRLYSIIKCYISTLEQMKILRFDIEKQAIFTESKQVGT